MRLRSWHMAPVEHFEWHNLRQEASYKCPPEISMSLSNLLEFHPPAKNKYIWRNTFLTSVVQVGKRTSSRTISQYLLNASTLTKSFLPTLLWKDYTAQKSTFFCISKSKLMLSSVTILGDLPCIASGVVATMSCKTDCGVFNLLECQSKKAN